MYVCRKYKNNTAGMRKMLVKIKPKLIYLQNAELLQQKMATVYLIYIDNVPVPSQARKRGWKPVSLGPWNILSQDCPTKSEVPLKHCVFFTLQRLGFL
jgi:hypothetical protein